MFLSNSLIHTPTTQTGYRYNPIDSKKSFTKKCAKSEVATDFLFNNSFWKYKNNVKLSALIFNQIDSLNISYCFDVHPSHPIHAEIRINKVNFDYFGINFHFDDDRVK